MDIDQEGKHASVYLNQTRFLAMAARAKYKIGFAMTG